MIGLFRAVVDRVKGALLATAATEIQSDMALTAVQRKADLHRQANLYENEGLKELAKELRERATRLDDQQPLDAAVGPAAVLMAGPAIPVLAAASEPEPEPKASRRR